MRILIGELFPVAVAFPTLMGCGLLGALLLWPVRRFLVDEHGLLPAWPVVRLIGVWLFAVMGLLVMMSPAPRVLRIEMVLLLGFLLQLAVIDAVSGWLPRRFTVACLCGGLLVSMTSDSGPMRVIETVAAGLVLMVFYAWVNRQRPQLGLGDVWLLCALVAWLGLERAMFAALFGTVGFLVWQGIGVGDRRRAGALGPWLCLGGVLMMIDRLYTPVWGG